MKNIVYSNKEIENGYKYVLNTLDSSISKPNSTTIIMKDGKPIITSNIDDISKLLYSNNKFKNIGVKLARLDLDKGYIQEYKSFILLLSSKLFDIINKYSNTSEESIQSILTKLDEEYNKNIINIIKSNKIDFNSSDIDKLLNYYNNFLPKNIIDLIIETINNTGVDGVINIDESNKMESYTEIINGMVIDRGSYSDQLINRIDTDLRLKEPFIFITDYKLNSIREIEPIFQYAFKNQKPLFIIADDYDKDFMQGIDYIKRKNNFITGIIKTPAYGERKIEFLNDIACYTGSKLVSSDFGDSLSSKDIINKLGKADNVIIGKEQTKILDGHYNYDEYKNRIKFVEDSIKNSNSDFSKENNLKRLAKLKSNISVIYIGGYTDTEREFYKQQSTELLNILLGITANGGSRNPYQLISYLNNFYSNCNKEESYYNNHNIICIILEEVFTSIQVYLKEVISDNKYNIVLPLNDVLELFNIAFSSAKMRLSTSVVVKK